MSVGGKPVRRRLIPRVRGLVRIWPVWVTVALILVSGSALSLASVDAQGLPPTVQLDAPSRVKLGAPVQVSISVRDVADLGGYEAELSFDPRVAALNGIGQRRGDLKSL